MDLAILVLVLQLPLNPTGLAFTPSADADVVCCTANGPDPKQFWCGPSGTLPASGCVLPPTPMVRSYEAAIFTSGTFVTNCLIATPDPQQAPCPSPVRILDIGKPPVVAGESSWLRMADLTAGIPEGDYLASVRSVGDLVGPFSQPTEVFHVGLSAPATLQTPGRPVIR